ncbi:hypothetical protein [Cellulomonas hominis]
MTARTRRQVRRAPQKLAVAAVAGGLLVSTVLGALPSSAAEVPEADGPVYRAPLVSAFAAQAAELPAGLTDAVARDLGMTGAEYLANAEAGVLAADVLDQLGGTVSRSWIGADLALNVVLTNPTGTANAEELGATVVTDPLGDEAAACNAADPGRVWVVDRPAGTLVSAPVDSFETYGYEDQVVRGGYGFVGLTPAQDQVGRCSVGFGGYGPAGEQRYLSAGHCVEEMADDWWLIPLTGALSANDDWAWAADIDWDGAPMSTTLPGSRFGGGDDGSLLQLTTGWTVAPQMSDCSGGTGDPSAATGVNVLDSANAVAGAAVCKSGATTGYTCGTVLAPEETVTVDGTRQVSGFIADVCSTQGDSGGAMMSGSYALGVVSAGNGSMEADGLTCVDDPDSFMIGYAVSSGSANAVSLLGGQFSLAVHVGATVITAPAPVHQGTAAAMTGTSDAAVGATVTVLVDGASVATTTVGAAGAWSTTLPADLTVGDHTVTAVASHHPVGSSRTSIGPTSAAVTLQVQEAPPAPEPPVVPATPTVALSTASVAAGGTVGLTGTGFRAGEQLEAWLHSDPVRLAGLAADLDGAISLTVTIPAATPTGEHTVVVVGLDGTEVRVPLTVTTGVPTAPAAPDGGAATQAGGLAATGASVALAAAVTASLVAVGTLAVVARRRRATAAE